ncbi:MAG: hypothetical protein DI555_00890 [Novosphingobium pentaromativorans]|uniref:Uncharacterized protein n=1 Tax=Novosphingobium pentaromativorans TaxID=205844 RepID=A0A2W5P059_9SPHN|nr:MAG: hypothetical protein DI555_00890 [Novosphingobium pentaromativorans]
MAASDGSVAATFQAFGESPATQAALGVAPVAGEASAGADGMANASTDACRRCLMLSAGSA